MSNYYPGTDPITPNLLLALWGMDEVIADDFIKIDEAFGSISSSISVNGVAVSNPNFVDSATATFSVSGSDVSINASGGSGTVTSFSAGNLSPLFTTSVANPTTTPALSFSLSTQNNNLVFAGPTSGGPLAPTFRALVAGDIPSLPYISSSLMTTLGDILYENATPAPARLAGNTSATKMYLSQTGNGTISAAPAWAQIAYVDISGTPSSLPPSGSAGGDLGSSYPNPTVIQINGAVIPTSKTIVGTNSSGQLVDASSAALSNNTSGTAANLSGTPALPNGTTATTQAQNDASTKLATNEYVDRAVPIINTAPDYFLLPYGDVGLLSIVSVATMAQNYGYMGMFHIDGPVTFTKASVDVTTQDTASGTHFYLGIYSLSGTLLKQITIPITASTTGLMGTTISAFTLNPGTYFMMWASDSSSTTLRVVGANLSATYLSNLVNGNQVRFGYKSGQLSGGSLASPVTFSGFTKNANAMPLVILEP